MRQLSISFLLAPIRYGEDATAEQAIDERDYIDSLPQPRNTSNIMGVKLISKYQLKTLEENNVIEEDTDLLEMFHIVNWLITNDSLYHPDNKTLNLADVKNPATVKTLKKILRNYGILRDEPENEYATMYNRLNTDLLKENITPEEEFCFYVLYYIKMLFLHFQKFIRLYYEVKVLRFDFTDEEKAMYDKKLNEVINEKKRTNTKLNQDMILVEEFDTYTSMKNYIDKTINVLTQKEKDDMAKQDIKERVQNIKKDIEKFRIDLKIPDEKYEEAFTSALKYKPDDDQMDTNDGLIYYNYVFGLLFRAHYEYFKYKLKKSEQEIESQIKDFKHTRRVSEIEIKQARTYELMEIERKKNEVNKTLTENKTVLAENKSILNETKLAINEAQRLKKKNEEEATNLNKKLKTFQDKEKEQDFILKKHNFEKDKLEYTLKQLEEDVKEKGSVVRTFKDVQKKFDELYNDNPSLQKKKIINSTKLLIDDFVRSYYKS